MTTDHVVETDVLVVGGGLAGAFAALTARQLGMDVILADKAHMGKSGGAALGASWLAVYNPKWGHDMDVWMNFITGIGEYLNDRDWVRIVLEESYERYHDLLNWRVPFASSQGRSPTSGSHAMPLVKNGIMPVLRAKVLEADVKVLDRVMITDLLKAANRVCGAVGFDARNGAFYAIKAKATVVATGSGAFKMPGWTDSYWTADGDAMCCRAGAEMVGKEFGGKDGGLLKEFGLTRIGMAGGYDRYVNGRGEAFLPRYAPKYETETRRMIASLFEVHAGRGPIFLDFDSAAAEERERAAKAARTSGLDWVAERVGFDAKTVGKTEVSFGSWVGNQPSQGGVYVDTECASTLPGLYAAGDCAGTRMCGSCYAPMGYGLAGASVTGHRAGQNAASFAGNADRPRVEEADLARLRKSVYAPLQRTGGFGTGFLTETLRNLVAPYFVMQVKHGERLRAALTLLEFLKGHLIPRMRADDVHDLRRAHEVRNMALNAEMCLQASLFRTESRGTHYREDFPRRADPEWLAWTILKEEKGAITMTRRPIPQAWWPDLSAPYEERYELTFPTEVPPSDE